MRFPLGVMTVGDILDRGLRVLFDRLPAFYAINVVVLAPYIAINLALPFVVTLNTADIGSVLAYVGGAYFGLFVLMVCQPVGVAAILHIVMQEYAGRAATVGEAFRFAFARFVPLVLGSLLYGLVVGVGFMLCCVPGVYFGLSFLFFAHVIVLERLGVGESLQRSQYLVGGHRWRAFALIVLIYVVLYVVIMVVNAVLGQLLPPHQMVPVAGGVMMQVNPVNYVVVTLLVQGVAILFSTYLAVCVTLLYLDLRIRKEGFDLELASQQGLPPAGYGPPADPGGYDSPRFDDRPEDR